MTYPRTSNFQSGNAFDAHWAYVEGAVSNVCATVGVLFVRALQQMFGLAATGVWDASLQSALVNRAASFEAAQPNVGWAGIRDALASDLQSRRVSKLSVQFGLYVLYYRVAGRRFDSIFIQDDAVLPAFDVPPAESIDGNDPGIVCFDPRMDVPPELLSGQNLNLASSQSSTGVRLGPGRPVPASTISPAPFSSSGASTVFLVLAGIAFAAFVVYAGSRLGASK